LFNRRWKHSPAAVRMSLNIEIAHMAMMKESGFNVSSRPSVDENLAILQTMDIPQMPAVTARTAPQVGFCAARRGFKLTDSKH
jgi:hypothetical protein